MTHARKVRFIWNGLPPKVIRTMADGRSARTPRRQPQTDGHNVFSVVDKTRIARANVWLESPMRDLKCRTVLCQVHNRGVSNLRDASSNVPRTLEPN
jgi:hypothetical protein